MLSEADIEARFWKELRANPTLMIGLVGAADAHAQPMRAFLDGDHPPIWFFTARGNNLVTKLAQSHHAIANYVAKGHEVFASIHGRLSIDNDPATIDRFWNDDEARWYEGGRDDPSVTLLRLDADKAEIWLPETGFGGAITRLLGRDPKQAQAERTAEVRL
jgi:general stress protein 26